MYSCSLQTSRTSWCWGRGCCRRRRRGRASAGRRGCGSASPGEVTCHVSSGVLLGHVTRVQGRTGTRVCMSHCRSGLLDAAARSRLYGSLAQVGIMYNEYNSYTLDFVVSRVQNHLSQYFSYLIFELCMSNYLHKTHSCKDLM